MTDWNELDVYDLKSIPDLSQLPAMLAVQLLRAAAEVGYDGEGTDGLRGWLRRLAEEHPQRFATLLQRLLPERIQQHTVEDHTLVIRWEDETLGTRTLDSP